jgi:hypothetical protein
LSLERLGDAAIIISVFGTSMFILGYGSLAPWWRTSIGRSLLLSKSWICAITWLAFLRTVADVSEDNYSVSILRTIVWVLLPVVSVYTFWALLVKGQIVRGRRKNSE